MVLKMTRSEPRWLRNKSKVGGDEKLSDFITTSFRRARVFNVIIDRARVNVIIDRARTHIILSVEEIEKVASVPGLWFVFCTAVY